MDVGFLLLVGIVGGVVGCGSGGLRRTTGTGGKGAGGAGTGAGGAGVDAAVDSGPGAGGSGVGGRAEGTGGAPPAAQWQTLGPLMSRKVDMLFMVDNSQSMAPLQAKLLAGFPLFINQLKMLPLGLPDLHLAVVSSDTGPGKFDLSDRHCGYTGDGGRFQSVPRGACTAPPLPAGQTFLAETSNQTVKNYAGDISDAFTCIAALGDQGCGFEGQLKSVRWALDPINAPFENQGFLRAEALLVVVLLTNEDDCSVPDDSDLADTTKNLESSPLGPLSSYRCNEFGHLCSINGTLQSPPRAAATNLQGCVSNDSITGKLTKVGDEVAFLKGLKSDPSQIVAAAITGPAVPYGVTMVQNPGDPEPHPNVVHSCVQNSSEYADPAVRIKQWVDAFGVNGLNQTICAASLAAPLQAIATKIGSFFGATCVSGPSTASPICRVVDRSVDSTGATTSTLLPVCVPGVTAAGPCWMLSDDVTSCPGGKVLSVKRGGPPAPAVVVTLYNCAPCAPGSSDLGCP